MRGLAPGYTRRLIQAGLPRANAGRMIAEFVNAQGWEIMTLRYEPFLGKIDTWHLCFNPKYNLFEKYGVSVTPGESHWEKAIRKQVLHGLGNVFLSNPVT